MAYARAAKNILAGGSKSGGYPKLGSGKRFSNLTKKLAAKGAKNPKALAAFIGMKKYGKEKMMKMAVKGKMMMSEKEMKKKMK